MKLAEALLQDRPIRCIGSTFWVTPIIHQDKTGRLYLKYMNENTWYYLNNYNFNCHKWEIKQDPMKHEFESEVLAANGTGYLYFNIVPSSFVGKKVKVIVEEIVE